MWNGALVGSTPEQIAQNSGHDFFGGLSRQSQMTKSATVRKLKVSGLLESLQAELVAARWPERITQNEECLLRAEKLMQTSNDGSLLRPDMFKWAKANRAAEQFDILVHATGDQVSNMIINTGSWEKDHLQATEMFHQKNNSAPFRKRYLDIGANLGYFSLLAASRGYEVTAFEAMAKNARLIKVSLCANPELEKRITLHNVGLADKSKKCFIVSSDSNQADGILKCNPPKGFDPVAYSTTKEHDYQVRGEVQLETMNTMLSGDYFMMKIDIEGAEPMALSKEGSDEYFKKFGIKYFITESSKGSTSRVAYFQRLFSLGYSLRPVKYQLGVGKMWNGALVGSTPEQIAQNSGHDFFGASANL